MGPRGGVPPSLVGRRLYRFGPGDPSEAARARFLKEGRELADQEKAKRRDALDLPSAPPLPLAEVDDAHGETRTWIALETRWGQERGAPIIVGANAVLHGDRGLAEVGPNRWLAVGREGTLESLTPRAGDASTELRTLPIRYDAHGLRFRPFREACQLLSESSFTD